jgi:spore maturation protein CgeB
MGKRRKIDPRLVPPGFAPDPAIPPLRVVVLAEEGNLVEFDVADAFRAAGHQVMLPRYARSGAAVTFQGEDREPGALADRVMKFGPHLILSLNVSGVGFSGLFPGLAEIERIPLVVWFVDFPPVELPRAVPPDLEFALMLGYDASQLPRVREMGYRHVEHLPLGTTPAKFPPAATDADPPIAVGYAGNLHERLVRNCRRYLQDRIRNLGREDQGQFDALFEEGVAALTATETPAETAWEWLGREAPSRFGDPERAFRPVAHFLSSMISHSAAARLRRRVAQRLDPLGLHVWGEGWPEAFDPSRCHAKVPYERLHEVYHSCRVNLSISHAQNVNSVTQRLFDVPASGSFVLSDWRPCMAELFDIGEELIVFHSADEAHELAARFIADHAARKEVVRRGRARVLAEHTYAHRVERLTRAVLERWPEVTERPARRKTVVLTSPPETAAPLLGQVASALAQSRRQGRGLEAILSALRDEPKARGTVVRVEGVRAYEAGEYERALEHFRTALAEGEAKNHAVHFDAGRTLALSGDPGGAIPFFREAIRLCPNHPIYWTALSGCYLKLEDWPRARGALESALAQDPDCGPGKAQWEAFRAEIERCQTIPD